MKRLKDLEFFGVNFSGDASEAFARIPHCLEKLRFFECSFGNVQRLFKALGENKCGPTAIVMYNSVMEQSGDYDIDYTDVLVPLLKNPTIKKLDLHDDENGFTGGNDFPTIKAAFESNQGLEELYISSVFRIKSSVDLTLLFEGIAAAPKLRILNLELWNDCWDGGYVICELFARALTDSKNKSLEKVNVWSFDYDHWNKEGCRDEEEEICKKIWKQKVLPILNFNSERRLFRENANSRSEGDQLFQALLLAEETDNHHFRFWLVRNYVDRLPRGGSKQA
jgi:hypothetical protein